MRKCPTPGTQTRGPVWQRPPKDRKAKSYYTYLKIVPDDFSIHLSWGCSLICSVFNILKQQHLCCASLRLIGAQPPGPPSLNQWGIWVVGTLDPWRSTGTRLLKISPKCWLSNSFPTSSSCARRWCLSLCPASAGRSFRASRVRVTSRDFEKRWSTLKKWTGDLGHKKNEKKMRPLGLWGRISSGSGWYATLRADRWENWEDFRISQSISADRLGKCWISLKYVEKGQKNQKNQKTPRSLHLNDNKLSVAKSSAKTLENYNININNTTSHFSRTFYDILRLIHWGV